MDANRGGLTVGELLGTLESRLELQLAPGAADLDRPIVSREIQKPGLVLTGLFDYYQPERVQVFGQSEVRFLAHAGESAAAVVAEYCRRPPPLLVVTRGLAPPEALAAIARQSGTALVASPLATADVIAVLLHHLNARLAPRVTVHGDLLEIHGLGVLVLGESGIGKSECALELVARGHRLVADDVVEIRTQGDRLVGTPTELSRHRLEVRGLGIVDVRHMFGVAAVRESVAIEQVVELVRLEEGGRFDRLGESAQAWEVLGRSRPMFRIPVAPGRNTATLVELAARRELLQRLGINAARELREDVARRIARGDAGGDSP
ncbi:MAG: HPr(Ser) kinase/phosphatase [Acidobacteriota bacterium]